MNEMVKIDLKISRRNVLLLNSIIERGLSVKETNEKTSDLINAVPEEALQELTEISEDCLRKAGLTDLNDKLKSLK